eukprot:4378621-Prymnesium_polylepis.1
MGRALLLLAFATRANGLPVNDGVISSTDVRGVLPTDFLKADSYCPGWCWDPYQRASCDEPGGCNMDVTKETVCSWEKCKTGCPTDCPDPPSSPPATPPPPLLPYEAAGRHIAASPPPPPPF